MLELYQTIEDIHARESFDQENEKTIEKPDISNYPNISRYLKGEI